MNKRLICNTILIGLELIGFIITWFVNGISLFTYYTQDSNLLFFIACICYEIWMLKNRGAKEAILPRWIYVLKYISTSMLIVTFMVVVCVLAPMGFTLSVSFGIELLVGNANLFHHFLCPILGTFAFLKIDQMQPLSIRDNLVALIPTFLYAAFALWANIARLMYGPYPFLHVYEQSVFVSFLWIVLIFSVAYVLAFLLRFVLVKLHR